MYPTLFFVAQLLVLHWGQHTKRYGQSMGNKKHEMSYIYGGFSRNLSSKQVAGQCSDVQIYTSPAKRYTDSVPSGKLT